MDVKNLLRLVTTAQLENFQRRSSLTGFLVFDEEFPEPCIVDESSILIPSWDDNGIPSGSAWIIEKMWGEEYICINSLKEIKVVPEGEVVALIPWLLAL